jgi:hypothetical protein
LALAATVLATFGLGVMPGSLLHLVQRAAPATPAVASAPQVVSEEPDAP